jgi:hypothetical protein
MRMNPTKALVTNTPPAFPTAQVLKRRVTSWPSVVLPAWAWAALLACIGWASTTANPSATVAAIALLPAGAKLLWRRGEPPALAFSFGMQWMQATMSIFMSNLYDMSLTDYGGPELEQAVWLTMLAVLILAFGMRMGCQTAGASRAPEFLAEGNSLRINRIFTSWAVCLGISNMMGILAWWAPSITQLLLAFTALKWIPFFLLGYCVLVQRSKYSLLAAAASLEFVIGILGFFSAFKTVLLFLIVILFSYSSAFTRRQMIILLTTLTILATSGLVWTAIKRDHRATLNQDGSSQMVLISAQERLNSLRYLVARLTWDQLVDAAEGLGERISYVHFFAHTIAHVPTYIPHEDGALWLGAVRHVFTPRLLFPEKGALNDSELTRAYTGIEVSGVEQGTSIGIGYVGESYIDFGTTWMFAPILVLGLLFGLAYQHFIVRCRYKLVGAGIATSVLLFCGSSIDTSNVKLFGSFVTMMLVLSLVYSIVAGWWMSWLRT